MPDQPMIVPYGAVSREQARNMLSSFARMGWQDKAALPLAWLLLTFAACALRVVEFRLLARCLGTPVGTAAFLPVIDARQIGRAQLAKRSMRRAARIAPLRSDCLPQAIAGAVLCRLLGVPTTTCLGVQLKSDPKIAAHAWLCSGPVPITGDLSFGQFTVLLCFVSPKPVGARALAGLDLNL